MREDTKDKMFGAKVSYLVTEEGTWKTLSGAEQKTFADGVRVKVRTKLVLAKGVKTDHLLSKDADTQRLVKSMEDELLTTDLGTLRMIMLSCWNVTQQREVRAAGEDYKTAAPPERENVMWDAINGLGRSGSSQDILNANQALETWKWNRAEGVTAEVNLDNLFAVFGVAKRDGTKKDVDLFSKVAAQLPNDTVYKDVRRDLTKLTGVWMKTNTKPAALGGWLDVKKLVMTEAEEHRREQVLNDQEEDKDDSADEATQPASEKQRVESVQMAMLLKRLEKAEQRAERAEQLFHEHSVNVSARSDERKECNFFREHGTCKFGRDCKYKHVGGAGGRAGSGKGAKGACWDFRDQGKCARGDNCRFTH